MTFQEKLLEAFKNGAYIGQRRALGYKYPAAEDTYLECVPKSYEIRIQIPSTDALNRVLILAVFSAMSTGHQTVHTDSEIGFMFDYQVSQDYVFGVLAKFGYIL